MQGNAYCSIMIMMSNLFMTAKEWKEHVNWAVGSHLVMLRGYSWYTAQG